VQIEALELDMLALRENEKLKMQQLEHESKLAQLKLHALHMKETLPSLARNDHCNSGALS
jgi:hypothetical protein